MPLIARDPDVPQRTVVPEIVAPLQSATPVPTTPLDQFVTGATALALKNDVLRVLDFKVLPVETKDAANTLAERRARVKVLLKDIDERRKGIVESIKRAASEVDAEARRWSEPLKAWDKDAERVLLAFQRMESDKARREEEERQKALIAAAKKQAAAEEQGNVLAAEEASREIMRAEAAPPVQATTGFKTDTATTFTRKAWKVEIVDASLVPSAYLVPDLKKLQAAVDAGARAIDGCNIFEHESLPVRTRV